MSFSLSVSSASPSQAMMITALAVSGQPYVLQWSGVFSSTDTTSMKPCDLRAGVLSSCRMHKHAHSVAMGCRSRKSEGS